METLLRDLTRWRKAPSRGPVQRSTKSSSEASASSADEAAGAAVSAERLRAVVPADLAAGAVLQRRLSAGGRPLAALEGPAALSPDGRGPCVSSRAEPTSARSPGSERRTSRSACRRPRVGHRPTKNLRAPVIGLAAMRRSIGPAGRRRSDSARGRVGVPWSASSSASDGGAGDGPRAGDSDRGRVVDERSVLRVPVGLA